MQQLSTVNQLTALPHIFVAATDWAWQMPIYFFGSDHTIWNSLLSLNNHLPEKVVRADLIIAKRSDTWTYQVLPALQDFPASQQFVNATLMHEYCPPTSPPPFKSGPWSLKKKWHPPLTMTLNSPISEVSTQETKCLGQTPLNAFSSRFSGFSICHPIYHENTMLLLIATRHAIYSAAVSTEETATFMLLPSWNKKMTTNPYASLCRKYPHMCKFPGTIPSDQLQYAKVPFW